MPPNASRTRTQFMLGVVAALGLASLAACSRSPAPPTYRAYSYQVETQVNHFCDGLDASHFVVKGERIFLKRKSSGESFPLRILTTLPGGYYFCSKGGSEGSDLE